MSPTPPPTRIARSLGRWLLRAALLAACATAQAQPRYGLSPDAYAALQPLDDHDLRRRRGACAGGRVAAASRGTGARVSQAFADGPPAEDVQSVRRAAEARQAALARFPASEYRVEGVNADALARLARVPPRSFANDQVQRYATGYRANAIAGLGIVGGSADRTLLARYAGRRGDPLALAAAEAQKTLDGR